VNKSRIALFSVVLFTSVLLSATAQITTIAGNGTAGYSGDKGAAAAAEISSPISVALDAAGNLYIADSHNNCIRKVSTSGIITTVAGNGTNGYNGDNIPATAAELSNPTGVALDSAGNLYIADLENSRIRKVSSSGLITTVAGKGTPGFSGDGGAATSAELLMPFAIALDSAHNLFIADNNNYRIRKVDAAGVISTVVGDGTAAYNGDGIMATFAEIASPTGVALDSSGNLYIADQGNNRIRKVSTSGIISTVAGGGTGGLGEGGAATSAELSAPTSVVADSSGNLYIADANDSCIVKVNTSGIITIVAGNGTFGYNGDHIAATSAKLALPAGVALDSSGSLYIADSVNNRIRKVRMAGP
jgi:sugar lactone lactonase YvrE